MNERAELRLFSDDEVKIIAYEWDGLKMVVVSTTYDKTWVSSQLSDDPPDDGWWVDEWCAEHDYDNTFENIPIDDPEEDNRWLPEWYEIYERAAEMSPSYHGVCPQCGHERCQCKDEEEI